MYVVIAGGGNHGSYLAAQLQESHYEVLIIEKNQELVSRLKSEMRTQIIWGDACDPRLCEEAEMGRAGSVLALTGDDEDNLVISQLAKQEFKVETVVARINNPRNAWLFDQDWGIDIALDSPRIAAEAVAKFLAKKA